jgi:hypothetical protein
MVLQFGLKFDAGGDGRFEGNIGINTLSFDTMGHLNHSYLRNPGMGQQDSFYLSNANAVPGDYNHFINSPDNPEITIFVPAGAVIGAVVTGKLVKIGILEPLRVIVDSTHHSRPGMFNA